MEGSKFQKFVATAEQVIIQIALIALLLIGVIKVISVELASLLVSLNH